MKKINFMADVLPHMIAVATFALITTFFFSPIFFDNKALNQHDINQFVGSSKTIVDHRKATGEESLWANNMFSGMPAYMISVQWSNQAVSIVKRIVSFSMPSLTSNVYFAFLCYYILLITLGVRPYLAIAGALAFGLSTYVIVGVTAGHNARIGAIAFMPLVMAGIHLAFSRKLILGFGLTTMAMALHLRENHLQITYYLMLIVLVYGLIRLIQAVREKQILNFGKTVGALLLAVVLGSATFFGQLWAISEYTAYSIRGKSELAKDSETAASGLTKEYAFAYNYGILEPLTLLVPQFYGGSSANFFVQNQKSTSYQALVQSNDNQLANQLASYTSAYWGPQAYAAAPYYAGSIIIFLFVLGILFAPKEYVWWLVPLAALSIMLSWGESFKTFNYFMFDYFPGYNKFRSVNFALVIILFAMPLLGLLAVESIIKDGLNAKVKRKLVIAFGVVGGLCFLLWVFAGSFGFLRDVEADLPVWFKDALAEDRKALFKADAFRSFMFITITFLLIYFNFHKRISAAGFYAALVLLILIDLWVVNKRYLTESNYNRKREATFTLNESDAVIQGDKSYYRVYNLENPMAEARTSYFHKSAGGYHGAKLRRYQDFYDSCLAKQQNDLIRNLQQGQLDISGFSGFNMLNIRYLVFGPQRGNVLVNEGASGPAWFVRDVKTVNSPSEELSATCGIDVRTTAVVDGSKFKVPSYSWDSTATVTISDFSKPNYLKYESTSTSDGLVVFSEVFYPGWNAFVDGKQVEIIRANYLLRALALPAGQHTIEFRFEPKPYITGNVITGVASWLTLFTFLGAVVWSLRKEKD